MTTTTYPDGSVLTSSALSPAAMAAIWQPLTCGMLGIVSNSAVRIEWPEQGQPFGKIGDDICYLRAAPQDVDYGRIRDMYISQLANTLTQNWVYTRGWRISWVLYGPNATDRARMVYDAMFMDYFNEVLAQSNLYLLADMPQPVRLPELINAQWWERADFYVDMYEQVNETITAGIVKSVDVTVQDQSGIAAQFTVQES